MTPVFIDGERQPDFIVSYSEISSFRQCPHKHMLGYRERWVAPTRSPALQKGTLFHVVLEEHYRALRKLQLGKLKRNSFAKYVYKRITPYLYDENGNQSEIQELVEWMYQGYVEHWGLDEDWHIVSAEHEAEIWLPGEEIDPKTGKNVLSNMSEGLAIKLKVKIDVIAKHIATKKLYVWDHKSGQNLPSDKELAIDDQFGLYTWAMRQLGRPIWGSLYNAARTQRNKTGVQTLESRMSRTPLYRLDGELDTIALEAYRTAVRAYSIPEGQAERSPNTDTCKWKCEYLEPCLAGRKGIDERVFLKDLHFVQNFERH